MYVFLTLVHRELSLADDDSSQSFRSLGMVNVVKSVVAFACLQKITLDRELRRNPKRHIFSFYFSLSAYVRLHAPKNGHETGDAAEAQDGELLDDGTNAFSKASPDASDFQDTLQLLIECEQEDRLDHDEIDVVENRMNLGVFREQTRISWSRGSFSARASPAGTQLGFNDFVSVDSNGEDFIVKSFHTSSNHLLTRLQYFSKFASSSYGSHFMRIFGIGKYTPPTTQCIIDLNNKTHHINHYAFSQHTGIPLESILTSSCEEQEQFPSTCKRHAPNFYICLDHQSCAVVVTIRGTLGLSDVLTNLACTYADLWLNNEKHQAHAGMLMEATRLSKPSSSLHIALRKALLDYPTYDLILVGHSLGRLVVASTLPFHNCLHHHPPPPFSSFI